MEPTEAPKKCVLCGKEFVPVLKVPDEADKRDIDEIYPHATAEEKMQISMGVCSTDCFLKC